MSCSAPARQAHGDDARHPDGGAAHAPIGHRARESEPRVDPGRNPVFGRVQIPELAALPSCGWRGGDRAGSAVHVLHYLAQGEFHDAALTALNATSSTSPGQPAQRRRSSRPPTRARPDRGGGCWQRGGRDRFVRWSVSTTPSSRPPTVSTSPPPARLTPVGRRGSPPISRRFLPHRRRRRVLSGTTSPRPSPDDPTSAMKPDR